MSHCSYPYPRLRSAPSIAVDGLGLPAPGVCKTNKASRAGLTGEPSALKERVARLLEPLSAEAAQTQKFGALLTMLPAVWPPLALGIIFGEPGIRELFWVAG
jgi:hypothetical protein